MNSKIHHYDVTIEWTGNLGTGTSTYTAYDRGYDIRAHGKPSILGSADPAFRGDASRWNPEDLLVASVSACHKLWYLHLCAVAGIVVVSYEDNATGSMIEDPKQGGHFTEVVLRPKIAITASSDINMARDLHHQAHEKCFIANSVNFPVQCRPEVIRQDDTE
jgi:organic hydroperoxide reductase OsmC/OhrA